MVSGWWSQAAAIKTTSGARVWTISTEKTAKIGHFFSFLTVVSPRISSHDLCFCRRTGVAIVVRFFICRSCRRTLAFLEDCVLCFRRICVVRPRTYVGRVVVFFVCARVRVFSRTKMRRFLSMRFKSENWHMCKCLRVITLYETCLVILFLHFFFAERSLPDVVYRRFIVL